MRERYVAVVVVKGREAWPENSRPAGFGEAAASFPRLRPVTSLAFDPPRLTHVRPRFPLEMAQFKSEMDDVLDLKSILKADLKEMVKEKTGLYNRLRSIADDSAFVASVCQSSYPDYAVVPNLRCGAW